MYYYVIDEYRVSNELLTEDIYVRHGIAPCCTTCGPTEGWMDRLYKANTMQALQSAVQRIEMYVKTVEEKVDSKRK
jgi:hypothetical protein